jgi:hypothetical protein
VHVAYARVAWWCVSKATSCELWRDCYNSQGANFGVSQMMKSIVYSSGEANISIFIGCVISTPNGSIPRGYIRIFLSIGSKVYSSFSSSFDMTYIKQFLIPFLLDIYISLSARPALPMGVAPEAMVGYLEVIIG